jgi:predicted neuraminidase
MKWFILFAISIVTLVSCQQRESDDQRFRSAIIFPYQEEHVHGSTVVNLPNGDVLSAWFQGSGERWADDVRIMGSRLVKGDTAWSLPFVLADVKGFPDINPILFMDKKERLWLMWYPVLANQWETSIPMYRISENYNAAGAPVWSWQEVLFVKVGDKTERGIQENDLFVKEVSDQLKLYEEYLTASVTPSYTDSMKNAVMKEWERYKVKMDSLSKGENMIRSGRARTDNNTETSAPLGYPLTRRLGWQTKNKAVFVGDRMIVPLYSDGFDCSLFAISDDGGQSWSYSNPVLGGAGIQATIAIGKDSLLVAYLRDNGPPPNRMQRTESRDKGLTWTIAKDDILPNPGAGFDVVTLSTGEWVMVFNDTENGRHNLSVAVSDDNGKSWKWKKSIEHDTSEKPTSSHYPAIIADSQDRIHITYSYHRNDIKPGRTIKYVSFPLSYLKNG